MDTASARLRHARITRGFDTAGQAADAFGWNRNTYASNENGNAPFSYRKAREYAAAFGVRPEWLYAGDSEGGFEESSGAAPLRGMRPVTQGVPVIGQVQAGAWAEVVDDDPEPEEFLPVVLKGFEGARLYALRVSGTSMNLEYKEGERVIVCPAAEIGVREGDHVVVRRRRGSLVETTLKEVVVEADGIALWPRSSDPNFQDPIRIRTTRDADEGAEIIAVVVSSYKIRPLQARPLIQL